MKNNKTEKNPIKRKGYYLGDRIGNYKIAQIKKRAVTLNTASGKLLTVKLIRRLPNMDKAPKKKHPRPKITSTRSKNNNRRRNNNNRSIPITPTT